MHGSRFFALLTVALVACGGNYGRIAGPAAGDSLGIRSVTPADPTIDTSNGVVYVSSEDTDIVIL